jgi:DNA-binding beta-propeller fold protein YncE
MTRYPLEIIKLIIIFEGLDLRYPEGNILVVDGGNNRIQKFDSNGTFITKWGISGAGDGQFEQPTGIAIDSLGNVYVVDRGNSRIQVFAPQ